MLLYQLDLGGSYCNYGNLIRDEGNPAESLQWYDLAIQTLKPVHDEEPRDATARLSLRNSHSGRARTYALLKQHAKAVQDLDQAIALSPPGERPRYRVRRAISQLQSGMVAEAVAEVAELTKNPNWHAPQWYFFACAYAAASGKIAGKKQQYADRAMELLNKAVQAGWTGAAHMAKNKDLDPLRQREDFQKLLAELEKK